MSVSIAVIGAGISGLSCARLLTERGHCVRVFEKSRSLGGRCSSRLWRGSVVDHGAQYFTAPDSGFRAYLASLPQGDIRPIIAPIELLGGGTLPEKSGRRFFHTAGNNRLGKALADGLSVRQETSVTAIASSSGKWKITAEGGAIPETFDAVVSCVPWPQTARLLGLGNVGRRDYAPCLTAFYAYAGDGIGLTSRRYALLDPAGSSALAWSACENHKVGRVRSGETIFVVQASEGFSREHLEADPESWFPLLAGDLEEAWQLDPSTRLETFAHRWRFARAIGELGHSPELPPGIFVTGDSFGDSRIESVWKRGRETAAEVLSFLG